MDKASASAGSNLPPRVESKSSRRSSPPPMVRHRQSTGGALAAAAGFQGSEAVGNDDPEFRAGRARHHKLDLAAMSAGELACYGKPETRAAGAGGTLKGLEQMVAGLLRNAGTIVLDGDGHACRRAMRTQAHRTFSG